MANPTVRQDVKQQLKTRFRISRARHNFGLIGRWVDWAGSREVQSHALRATEIAKAGRRPLEATIAILKYGR
jgi:hypothetical protein